MVSARHPPSRLLRGLVAPYVGYRHEGLPPGTHHGLPSTTLTLVVSLDAPLDVAWAGDDRSRRREWIVVSGLHTAPALIRHDGSQHGVQVALAPLAARALLGVPAAALRDELLPLRDVVGRAADRLYDEVAGAATWAERFARLDAGLARLAGRHRTAAVRPEVEAVWRCLHERPGLRVADLAAELGWSRRHLSTVVGAEVGLSPKEVAGVVRFQRARALIAAGTPLAAVAAAAGYADQPHLTREFRRLAGRTPTAWLREELPFVQEHGADQVAGSTP